MYDVEAGFGTFCKNLPEGGKTIVLNFQFLKVDAPGIGHDIENIHNPNYIEQNIPFAKKTLLLLGDLLEQSTANGTCTA